MRSLPTRDTDFWETPPRRSRWLHCNSDCLSPLQPNSTSGPTRAAGTSRPPWWWWSKATNPPPSQAGSWPGTRPTGTLSPGAWSPCISRLTWHGYTEIFSLISSMCPWRDDACTCLWPHGGAQHTRRYNFQTDMEWPSSIFYLFCMERLNLCDTDVLVLDAGSQTVRV